jgi:hypothetical protein
LGCRPFSGRTALQGCDSPSQCFDSPRRRRRDGPATVGATPRRRAGHVERGEPRKEHGSSRPHRLGTAERAAELVPAAAPGDASHAWCFERNTSHASLHAQLPATVRSVIYIYICGCAVLSSRPLAPTHDRFAYPIKGLVLLTHKQQRRHAPQRQRPAADGSRHRRRGRQTQPPLRVRAVPRARR